MLAESRIVIVGASGSGKTTLARSLSKNLALDLLELDPVHWSGKVGTKRDESEAEEIVAAFATRSKWIVEGVYGWLAMPAVRRARTLIWLQWAEAYWTRQTSSSFAGHRAIFDAFEGEKCRLQSREAIVEQFPELAPRDPLLIK